MRKLKRIKPMVFNALLIHYFLVSILSCTINSDNLTAAAPIIGITNATLPEALLKTYNGALEYEDEDDTKITETNATATISRTNSKYTISFSNNVPSLSNITFTFIDGKYVFKVEDPLKGIIIKTNSKLEIDLEINNNSWQFY